MAGIFKANDIRAIYGTELTDAMAYMVGRAYASYLKPGRVVIGHDMRSHSKALTRELSRGLVEQGVEVIHLGRCSTPMTYFAIGRLELDGGIMVTASHNAAEYNGFKLCRAEAVPMSEDSGLSEIETLFNAQAFDPPPETPGKRSSYDILPEYRAHVRAYAQLVRPLKIAVDFANAMGIMEAQVLAGLVEIEALFDTYDGRFPHHEANPLDYATYADLQQLVRGGDFDFGLAFDGDADRLGFVDETGAIISMDLICGLIAQDMLRLEKGHILYDLRSSWAIKEVIAEAGGTSEPSRVGHAFIKQQMRETRALFAGELSGHYYFRENFCSESTALAALLIANRVSQSGKKLSELVAPLRRYHASGEINSRVTRVQDVFDRIRANYPEGRVVELDGLSMEFEDWWFNVRPSNTEPVIRLNLEAKSADQMLARRNELLHIIRQPAD